jgi:uncharacterized OB-fold protein
MGNVPQQKQVIPVIAGAFEMEGKEPHLIGTKCSKCGAAFFPPRRICTYCLTDEGIQTAKLGNKGKLYAYTVINVASREFDPPYAFGFVILEPENIRIPTLISGVKDPEVLPPGTEMKMVIEKLRVDKSGNEVMTYKFRPVSKE